LRARAGNFDNQGIRKAVTYAHAHGVKIYITVNIFAHNRDLDALEEYLLFLQDADADALIVADPGILYFCQHIVPTLPVHLSTQANVANSAAVRFWSDQVVTRLNLARELGIEEIRTIRQATTAKLEVFVHGALCISYSGRCMLSNYFTGRNSNQGDCAHPCRYSYSLVEEKRPGLYFPVEEDERGTYIFNARDLCLLKRLPELVAAGVNAVKIEGRMKSTGYVASTVRVYRAALNYINEQQNAGLPLAEIMLPDYFHNEINKVGTRGQTENFFNESPSSDAMLYDTMRKNQPYAPVAVVRQQNPLLVEARNIMKIGDQIEYLGHKLMPEVCTIVLMTTVDGICQERANPGNRIIITIDPVPDNLQVNAIFRKRLKQKNK
ncbi:MAG: peptidase U32, partial [Candidatus Electrothrix sp. AR3]|nr:peptidase U32 [Candidatus Electrothrix sp. AR3]